MARRSILLQLSYSGNLPAMFVSFRSLLILYFLACFLSLFSLFSFTFFNSFTLPTIFLSLSLTSFTFTFFKKTFLCFHSFVIFLSIYLFSFICNPLFAIFHKDCKKPFFTTLDASFISWFIFRFLSLPFFPSPLCFSSFVRSFDYLSF